jgi:hypothetical protein
MPTLLGASIIVAVALLYNDAEADVRFPKFWF